MNYFKQIYYEMKHQRMMTWVSISGTALAIFLMMAFYMQSNIGTAAIAPESARDRILTGHNIDLKIGEGEDANTNSGGLSYETAKLLYDNLDGVDNVTYTSSWAQAVNVGLSGKRAVNMNFRKTDTEFWNIFDFTFISGQPYNEADVEDGSKKVVVTKSVARKIFGEEDVAGREVMIQHVPYTICGVVDDFPQHLASTGSDIFLPLDPQARKDSWNDYLGSVQALLLMSENASKEDIQRQVKGRYDKINASLKKEKKSITYHEQPYDTETVYRGGYGSNTSPDTSSRTGMMIAIYGVLLLLPAINLSSMTRSRLRHRISEIGVRRAFGASRHSIVSQLLGENFIITAVGGILGLLLSFLFMFFIRDLFFKVDNNSMLNEAFTPTMGMLFKWDVFLVAFIFCFVLNLMSAFVPAWRASRIEPSVAISKSK